MRRRRWFMAKPVATGETQGTVKEMRVQETLRETLRYEMARDGRVFVMGEDVALFGGAYGVTRGLLQEFGESRVLDTPISEGGIIGLAVGAAINGPRAGPTKFATGRGGGPSHSSCNHGAFIHFPGLKIIMPTTPADAKGLLLSAIRDPNPVLCFESHYLYGVRGPVPEGEYMVPIGKAVVRREGRDLTIVTCGGMVLKADAAADLLKQKGIDIEIVDLRSLAPLDKETIIDSVA